MEAPVIREYHREDVLELIRLWTDVFDDTEGFAEKFFTFLPDMGSGVVAELEGKIVGAAYTLNGQELSDNGKNTVVGYIYGVGVYERYRHRKIGEKLVKAVYALSKKREAEIVTTLPAEPGLYDWYEKLIGLKCCLYRKKYELAAEKLEMTMPMSSTEYSLMRENMLRGKTHIHLSDYSTEFEKQLLSEYGGGFYMGESGICAVYREGDTAIVREAIGPDEASAKRLASSVAAAIEAQKCRMYLPSASGERYIASDVPLPENCIWSLTFD